MRNEERSYLLMYLREFAGPDGILPTDFDGLVRDAFGDVSAHRRRVNPQLVQRAVWLAGITLIAALIALAITRRDVGSNRNLPGAVAVPGTKNGYYTAKAAPYGPTATRRRTACGKPFLKTTEGVAHPVLAAVACGSTSASRDERC